MNDKLLQILSTYSTKELYQITFAIGNYQDDLTYRKPRKNVKNRLENIFIDLGLKKETNKDKLKLLCQDIIYDRVTKNKGQRIPGK